MTTQRHAPMPDEPPDAGGMNAIAIVGIALRFPGAQGPAQFWSNLRNGVESVRQLTDEELLARGVPARMLRDPNYVKREPVLDQIDRFDAAFFGFSPKDAAILDPQHRQFLECCWEALEDAGHVPGRFKGPIGVYAGCGMGSYFAFNLLTNPELVESVGLFLLRHTGNDKDFLTTRVSYCLNLTGPSINIQTACSTSLVAVHQACQSLIIGECDMALAGGVTIEIPHGVGYLYKSGEILSPDGHCRAFDQQSNGTVFGSGAGVVVLRRLEDALADGDRIYAVIRGSAVNNDGSGKVGYLAPSVDGQAAVVAEALEAASVDPDTIEYIEAHGSGTPIGEPIEVAALTRVFHRNSQRRKFCGIGSVKPNIGHLDTAAGVASLIKVALALHHGELPPTPNYQSPNPAIPFAETPFFVVDRLRGWPRVHRPRRAGVTSLGVGGTNAHVVLEEAPLPAPVGR
jgi:acyl transferase domain-containing protein